MATIKSHTDLKQSKKLAEILPFKSADAFYDSAEPEKRQKPIVGSADEYLDMEIWAVPCWSLAALLSVLPSPLIGQRSDETWVCATYPNGDFLFVDGFDNPVDACYEMILELHELKVL